MDSSGGPSGWFGAAKMTDAGQIKLALSEIVSILRAGGNENWLRSIENFRAQMEDDPIATPPRILSIFGGMGSFNDLILYKNGQPLSKENEQLDRLRSKLYDLCHG